MRQYAMCSPIPVILTILLLCGTTAQISAETRTAAVLPFENSTGDARSDYLGKIAEALLMYDLTSQSDIDLVSRDELDVIMQEKQLALSGLVEGNTDLREIGGLSGADFLIRGEYVHLGDDLLFIVKLISVEDGAVTVLRERGTDENTVHRISEQVVQLLTGSAPELSSDEGRRSIISMKNEEPGSIALFSPLIDAEIFLDDQFVGYTTGDSTEPFLIGQIRPGPHTVRTHLTRDFGVIDLPQIRFRDWEEQVRVQPGQRTVSRDLSRHFNSFLYDMQWLLREDIAFRTIQELQNFETEEQYRFDDRGGTSRGGVLRIRMPDSDTVEFELEYDGNTTVLQVMVPQEEGSSEKALSFGLVELEAEIEYRYGRWELSYSLTRTDVYQGLHRVEYTN